MWELTIRKAESQRIDAFELWFWSRLLRVPWTARRSNQSILKEINSELFTRRSDAEAEALILLPPDVKSQLIGKDPDTGKHWRQKETEVAKDEMVRWHHWLYGHEFEQAPGVGDGQGGLVCCYSWGCKELDTTEWLNWTECPGGPSFAQDEISAGWCDVWWRWRDKDCVTLVRMTSE